MLKKSVYSSLMVVSIIGGITVGMKTGDSGRLQAAEIVSNQRDVIITQAPQGSFYDPAVALNSFIGRTEIVLPEKEKRIEEINEEIVPTQKPVTAMASQPQKTETPEVIAAKAKPKAVVINPTPWLRDVPLSKDIQKFLYDRCNMHGLDYDMMLGLIKAESTFNPKNISRTNDYGLMQVNRNNNKWLNGLAGRKLNMLDPKDNIIAGTFEIASYRNRLAKEGLKGDYLDRGMLLSYNRGMTGWKRIGRKTHIAYDNKIIKYQKEIASTKK